MNAGGRPNTCLLYTSPRDRHGEPIKDFLKAKPVTDSDKCVKCGLCARLCPMAAIDPNDVSSVVGKCIKCCACVKKCPKGAKYFDHEGYLYHQHELEAVSYTHLPEPRKPVTPRMLRTMCQHSSVMTIFTST